MSYEEQQARRSRVVVETPVARREVTQTESVRSPEGGMSGAAVGAIAVLAVALVTLLVLFLMSGQQTDTANEIWLRRHSRLLSFNNQRHNSHR